MERSIEDIIGEVQKEAQEYAAKLQRLQQQMPLGYCFKVPEIELWEVAGAKPHFSLVRIDIVRT